MKASENQQKAIDFYKGVCLTIAGPGSGKTTVLTRRLLRLVTELKVKENRILVITFAKAAAKEMEERYMNISKNQNCQIHFATFHSLFFYILRSSFHYSVRDIITESEKERYLKKVLMKLENNRRFDQDYLKLILENISHYKNLLLGREEFLPSGEEKENFWKIYDLYEEQKNRYHKIDFDDMCKVTLYKLKEYPFILQSWQDKFEFILVDEFQDINAVQYEVLKLLAGRNPNLFCVGDDDQSIYGFRGSNPYYMKHMEDDYPDISYVYLSENYRSCKKIVAAAIKLISNNKSRYEKEIICPSEKEGVLECFSGKDDEELELLAKKVVEAAESIPYKDMAVLVRNNGEMNDIIRCFEKEGIPYHKKKQKETIEENWIYQDISCYLKILEEKNMKREDLFKILYCPERGLTRDLFDDEVIDFEKLLKEYGQEREIIRDIKKFYKQICFCKQMNIFGKLHYILFHMGYADYVKRKEPLKEKDNSKWIEFLLSCGKDVWNLTSWQQRVKAENVRIPEQGEGVKLMTYHSSKGLEFHTVMLVHLNNQNFKTKEPSVEEIEEERRVFYVAVTRAKEQLFCFYKKELHGKELQPSLFLKEIFDL